MMFINRGAAGLTPGSCDVLLFSGMTQEGRLPICSRPVWLPKQLGITVADPQKT